MWRTLTATLALTLLAACSDSDNALGDHAGDVGAEPTAVACPELAGLPTSDVIAAGQCTNGETIALLAFANLDCPDGRTLHWNDEGWGYDPGDWQTHARPDGQLVPPQAEYDACSSGA